MRRSDSDIHLNLTDRVWKLHIFGTSKYPLACKCRTVIGPCKKLRSLWFAVEWCQTLMFTSLR